MGVEFSHWVDPVPPVLQRLSTDNELACAHSLDSSENDWQVVFSTGLGKIPLPITLTIPMVLIPLNLMPGRTGLQLFRGASGLHDSETDSFL